MHHTQHVYTAKITPDDRHIIAGVSGNAIVKSDRRTGEEVKRRENAYDGNLVLALVTNGNIIVSCCSDDKTVKVWNMDLEPAQTLVGHENGVRSVAISPGSTMIASGD